MSDKCESFGVIGHDHHMVTSTNSGPLLFGFLARFDCSANLGLGVFQGIRHAS